MSQPFINTLPLIIADEKPVLMNSILNMLREKGFSIIKRDLTGGFADANHKTKKMDGLDILRYVTQKWPKGMPVVIILDEASSSEAVNSFKKTA